MEGNAKLDQLASVAGLEDKERSSVFQIQTEILRSMTNGLINYGFRWILPVILAKSTDPLWPDPERALRRG